jgi:hypothetical protein
LSHRQIAASLQVSRSSVGEYARRFAASGLSALDRHRAGEKLFVDYAGHTVEVVDPASGEIRTASLGAACAAFPTLLK